MITYRELPLTEWAKLKHCPGLPLEMHPLPTSCLVIVAEDMDQIVGLWTALPAWRCTALMEGFWIHPDYRGRTRMPLHLIRTMQRLLAKHRISKAFCWSDRPEVATYMDRLGMTRTSFTTHIFYVNQPDAYRHSDPQHEPAGAGVAGDV